MEGLPAVDVDGIVALVDPVVGQPDDHGRADSLARLRVHAYRHVCVAGEVRRAVGPIFRGLVEGDEERAGRRDRRRVAPRLVAGIRRRESGAEGRGSGDVCPLRPGDTCVVAHRSEHRRCGDRGAAGRVFVLHPRHIDIAAAPRREHRVVVEDRRSSLEGALAGCDHDRRRPRLSAVGGARDDDVGAVDVATRERREVGGADVVERERWIAGARVAVVRHRVRRPTHAAVEARPHP